MLRCLCFLWFNTPNINFKVFSFLSGHSSFLSSWVMVLFTCFASLFWSICTCYILQTKYLSVSKVHKVIKTGRKIKKKNKMHGFHRAIWNSNTSVTAISVSTSTGKMWNLRSLWVTYLIVWASSHEPSWQHWSSYWGQFPLGFIWEISAWFPSWKKAKDPGDEFWHEIRETKETWQNTKIITFAPIIALVTLKAGINAVKWDASDAKNTAGNARRCHPGRQRSSRFHPGTRAKVMFIWQNFQPAYRDPGW